jgi:hypothetical protein
MFSGFDWQTIWPAFAVIGSLIAVTMGAVVYQFRKVVVGYWRIWVELLFALLF